MSFKVYIQYRFNGTIKYFTPSVESKDKKSAENLGRKIVLKIWPKAEIISCDAKQI